MPSARARWLGVMTTCRSSGRGQGRRHERKHEGVRAPHLVLVPRRRVPGDLQVERIGDEANGATGAGQEGACGHVSLGPVRERTWARKRRTCRTPASRPARKWTCPSAWRALQASKAGEAQRPAAVRAGCVLPLRRHAHRRDPPFLLLPHPRFHDLLHHHCHPCRRRSRCQSRPRRSLRLRLRLPCPRSSRRTHRRPTARQKAAEPLRVDCRSYHLARPRPRGTGWVDRLLLLPAGIGAATHPCRLRHRRTTARHAGHRIRSRRACPEGRLRNRLRRAGPGWAGRGRGAGTSACRRLRDRHSVFRGPGSCSGHRSWLMRGLAKCVKSERGGSVRMRGRRGASRVEALGRALQRQSCSRVDAWCGLPSLRVAQGCVQRAEREGGGRVTRRWERSSALPRSEGQRALEVDFACASRAAFCGWNASRDETTDSQGTSELGKWVSETCPRALTPPLPPPPLLPRREPVH